MQAVDNSGDIVDIKALHRSHDRSGLPAVSAVTGETADAGLHVYSFTGKRQPLPSQGAFCADARWFGAQRRIRRATSRSVALRLGCGEAAAGSAMARQKDALLTVNELCSVF